MNEVIIKIVRNNKTDVLQVFYADGHIEFHRYMTEPVRNYMRSAEFSKTVGDENIYTNREDLMHP